MDFPTAGVRTMAANLDVEIDETPQMIVVRLIGNAGTRETERLQMALIPLMAKRPSLVVFDLAKLAYVASLAMGMLVNFRRGLARNGGQVKLAAVPPLVLESFRAARLDELFEITETVNTGSAG
jgi:anti-anti-sigma factor